MSIYTVTKIKTFQGMEGSGFNATLMRDGKAVCDVIDDANGGSYIYRWLDRDAKATVKTLNFTDDPHEYVGTAEEAAFAAHCLALPAIKFFDREMRQSPDIAISGLVEAVRTEKRLKRMFKTKLVFINDGKEYAYGGKGIDPLSLVPELRRKYPNAVILNLLNAAEAVSASLAVAH